MDINKSGMAKTALSGMVWTFAERFSAQLVSLVVTVILARLLSPAEYAIVAIVTVFVTLANVFVTSGFGSALVQKIDADELDFSTTFFFSIALSIALYFFLFFTAPLIANYYEMPNLIPVVRVMSLRLVFASVNSIQQAYVAKRMEFKKFFFATFIGTVVSAVIGVLMAFNGMGVWALVAQYLSNVAIDTLVLGLVCGWKPIWAFSIERMKPLFSYGWKIIASDFFNKLCEQARSLVLSKVASPTDLSLYNQGERFPALFINNVETSMQKVLAPIVSTVQNDKERLQSITRKSVRVSTFVIWPFLFGLAAIAESIIEVLLTNKWAGSALYLRLACMGYLIYPVGETYIRTVKALGKSELFMKSMITSQVLGIVLLIAVIIAKLSPVYIISTWILSQAILCILSGHSNGVLINYRFTDRLSDLYKTAICCGALYFAVIIIPRQGFSALLYMLIQITAGVIAYILSSLVVNMKTTSYVYDVVASYFSHFIKGAHFKK